MNAQYINEQIEALEDRAEVGKISDGYHTFEELYEHKVCFVCSSC